MGRTSTALKGAARKAVLALPAPRDQAALRMLRAGRDLVLGRPSVEPAPRRRKRRPDAGRRPYGMPRGPKLPPVPRVDNSTWADPPVSDRRGLDTTLHDHGPTGRQVYDVALLEQLNEEYRSRPIVPAPRELTSEALGRAARDRVQWAHHKVDLAGLRVLEVGCGNGYEVWSMAHNLGADAYGVDIQEPDSWQDLVGDRVHLQKVDLTEENPFPENHFDRVVSYTTWEHVLHPHRLLEETFRIMKPGGLQWLRANLWAGPQASHRYRDIHFPWPHHLFSDEVIAAWDLKHGRGPEGAAWVNKLTWNHYERYFHDIGFRLRWVGFQKGVWDEDFYQRFEDVLGRIPRWDLERDFFTAVLEKPAP